VNPRQLHEAARAYSNPRQTKSPSSAQVRRRIKATQKFTTDASLSKVLPSTLMQPDQERLREEGRTLKLENNNFREENLRLRTKINQLGKELSKRDEVLDELRGQEGERHYYGAVKQVHLVTSLKQTVKDLRAELKGREEEAAKMKKNVKFTQVSELEAEIDAYIEECARLKKLVLDSARPISRGRLVNSIDQAQGQMITKLNKEKLLLERNLQSVKEELAKARQSERESRMSPTDMAAEVARAREDLSSKGKTLSQAEEKIKQLTVSLKSAQENAQLVSQDREKWRRKYEESQEESRTLRSRLAAIETGEAQNALQFIVTKLASKSVSFLRILQKQAANCRFQDLIQQVEATRVIIPEHYWQAICTLYISDSGTVALPRLLRDVEPLKPRLRDSSLLLLGKKGGKRESSGSELEPDDSPEGSGTVTSREEKAVCGRYREESDEESSDFLRESEVATKREIANSESERISSERVREKKASMGKKPNLQVEVIEYEPSESPAPTDPRTEAFVGSKSDIGLSQRGNRAVPSSKADPSQSCTSSRGLHQSESLPKSSRLSSEVSSDEAKAPIVASQENPFRIEESVDKAEELVSEKPESYTEEMAGSEDLQESHRSESAAEYEEDPFEAEEPEGKVPILPETPSPKELFPANEAGAVATELPVTFPPLTPLHRAETGSVGSPMQAYFPAPQTVDEPLTVKSFEDHMAEANHRFEQEGELSDGEESSSEEEKSASSRDHGSEKREESPVPQTNIEGKEPIRPENREESIIDFAPPEENDSAYYSEEDFPFSSKFEQPKSPAPPEDFSPTPDPLVVNPIDLSTGQKVPETPKKTETELIERGKNSSCAESSEKEGKIKPISEPQSAGLEVNSARHSDKDLLGDLEPMEDSSSEQVTSREVENPPEKAAVLVETASNPREKDSEISEEPFFEADKPVTETPIEPATENIPLVGPQEEGISPVEEPKHMEAESVEREWSGLAELFQSSASLVSVLGEPQDGEKGPAEETAALAREENSALFNIAAEEGRAGTPPESPQPEDSPPLHSLPMEPQDVYEECPSASDKNPASPAIPCDSPKSSSSEALEAKARAHLKAIALALTAQNKSVSEVFEAYEGYISTAEFLHGLRTLGLADLPPLEFQLLVLSLSGSESGEIEAGELEALLAVQGVRSRAPPGLHSPMSSLSGAVASRMLTPNPERASVQEMAAAEVLTSSAEESQNSFYEYAGEAGKCPDRLT